MNYGDPNRPQAGATARDHERHLGSEATGDFAKDGYALLERRPRVAGMTEPIDPARAEEIESIYQRFPLD